MQTVTDEAVAGLDRHLLQTLFKQCALQQHCDALKRYMLHGQGDFIESLMDLIGSQLDKPVRPTPHCRLNPPARLSQRDHSCHVKIEGPLGSRVEINEILHRLSTDNMALEHLYHSKVNARTL